MRVFNCSVLLSILMLASTATFAQAAPKLYAVDGRSCTPSTLYELDPTDGSIVATIGSTGVSGMTSMALNPLTGIMYGITTGGGDEGDVVCESNLYTINLATGAVTLIGPTAVPRGKPDAAFRADGTMFSYTTEYLDNGGGLYTVNLTTGAMTLVGDTGVSPWDISLTFEAGTLVMTDGDTIYTVDTSTGLATPVTGQGTETNDSNMSTTHPVTGQVYLGDSDNSEFFDLYTLNTTTGDMVLLGSNGVYQMSAIEFVPDGTVVIDSTPTAPVPTLAGWGMVLLAMLLGLAGLAFRRQHRT